MKRLSTLCLPLLLWLLLCGITPALRAQWTETSGPEGGNISSLIEVGGVMVAGSINGGIFRSTDTGRSWTSATLNPLNMGITSLATHADDLFATTRSGIYRSIDLGNTWQFIGAGLPRDTAVLCIEASDPTELLCGLERGGIYRSTNGGGLWLPHTLTEPRSLLAYFDLMRTDSGLLAATSHGMRMTRDSGRLWETPIPSLSGSGNDVNTLERSGDTIYTGTSRGFWKSGDEGSTWSSIDTRLFGVVNIQAIGVRGDTIVVGSSGGCHYSSDRGVRWNYLSNDSMPNEYVRDLLFRPGQVVAATYGGIYRSRFGSTWEDANSGLRAMDIEALATNDSTIHVGIPYMRTFRSTDRGSTWQAPPRGAGSRKHTQIHTLIAFGDTILAGHYGVALGGGNWSGVNRSTDDGATWTEHDLDLPQNHRVLELAGTKDLLYANTQDPNLRRGPLFRSTSGGSAWTRADTGLVIVARSGLHDAGAGRVFVGSLYRGIARSLDSGRSWLDRSIGLPDSATARAIIALDGSTLLAGFDGKGIYRSENFGDNWSAGSDGIDPGTTIHRFIIYRGLVLAGGSTGLYRSRDRGATWEHWDAGLPRGVTISRLALLGDELYAGTLGRGVWKIDLSGTVSVPDEILPLELDLSHRP